MRKADGSREKLYGMDQAAAKGEAMKEAIDREFPFYQTVARSLCGEQGWKTARAIGMNMLPL